MAFPREVQKRIIGDSLHTQERESSYALEMRLSHLKDLAHLVATHLIETTDQPLLEALGELSTHLMPPDETALHREALPANRQALKGALSALSRFDGAMLCHFLAQHMEAAGQPIMAEQLLPITTHFDLIACPSNSYATTAYTELLSDMASPYFVGDYREAISATRAGECDGCLVPFRDGEGEALTPFRKQLFSAGLLVSQVLSVQGRTHSAMELALCGRYLLPIEEGATWLLSLTTPTALPRLLDMAAYLGFTPTSVTQEGETIVSLIGEGDPIPLLISIHLFCREARVVGSYIHTR